MRTCTDADGHGEVMQRTICTELNGISEETAEIVFILSLLISDPLWSSILLLIFLSRRKIAPISHILRFLLPKGNTY